LLKTAAEKLSEARDADAHVVVARRQAEHSVHAAIVGLIAARGRELTVPLEVLVALDRDDRAHERFAVLVEDVPGDYAAANQPQIDAAGLLIVSELDGCSRLQRAALPVDGVDEPVFRRGDRVAARAQRGDRVDALIVGDRAASAAPGAGDSDLRALHRLSAVRGDHASGDGRRGRWGGRRIAWLVRCAALCAAALTLPAAAPLAAARL